MATELTPRQIVAELNRYIIGQDAAKRCVAIAIRNRWRRLQLEPHLREEVTPKNIIMIGPTGVGKTEIARRLAQLVKAPFLKVEASKYTEVGYHGRDVDSMIRDLVEVAINMVRQKAIKEVEEKAQQLAEEKLLKILLPTTARHHGTSEDSSGESTQVKLREKLKAGLLDDKFVEIQTEERIFPMMQVFSSGGYEEYGLEIQTILGDILPAKKVTRKVTVKEAQRILTQQEAQKLIDKEKVVKEGVALAENSGIIFIDEIDKIASSYKITSGPDVSREGVQRDLLPIVEGTTVPSRYGPINTQHILFISAGAFNIAKPSDLIPELQGRFPLRVELSSLGKKDFVRILTEPENALLKQYQALLATEGVTLKFTKDAIDEMAEIAAKVNATTQDIGARRLHTVVEKVLEEISFEAPDMKEKTVLIDRAYVKKQLKTILEQEDLKRYIL